MCTLRPVFGYISETNDPLLVTLIHLIDLGGHFSDTVETARGQYIQTVSYIMRLISRESRLK